MQNKWGILVKTLPLVGSVLTVRLVLTHAVGFAGIVEFSEIGMVLTGGVFLVGFMLAGVMADYKESEKIPSELAATLESVAVNFKVSYESKQIPNYKASIDSLRTLSRTILGWLYKKSTLADVYEALMRVEEEGYAADKAGAGAYANRVLSEITNVRKTITRMSAISRTNFLPSGYALLETLTGVIICLLFLTKFKNPIIEAVLVPFVSLIFFYMIRLIRDIDDPFEYSEDPSKNGGAEVSLFPLTECIARLESNYSTAESTKQGPKAAA